MTLVFEKLIQAGFAVKCEKVHLAKREVPYLGFFVGASGTRPNPSKTAALLDMICEDMGSDPAAAARYAGMIGYYHRHLPDLHSTLAPFHELKGKNANAKHIMGSLRFKAAFALTKYQLANVAALARPDYSKDFVVDVDSASSSGSGAILSQYDDPSDLDSLRPLAFWSRRFTSEERRYGVRDQECVGLVDALMAWRQYVVGARTVVRTDHKSLEWLLRTAHRDGTRVSGLALKVQGFDIEIQYVPGRDHGNPDCVSRALPRTLAEGEQLGALDDSRPDIDDRVEDAASLANAVVSVACNRDLDPSLSSLPIAAVFSLLASCSLPATAAALFSGGGEGEGSTSVSSSSPTTVQPLAIAPPEVAAVDECSTFASAPEAEPCAARHQHLIQVLFLRPTGPGTYDVMVHRQDGLQCIPSTERSSHTHRISCTMREQLSRYFRLTYTDSTEACSQLATAKRYKCKRQPHLGVTVSYFVNLFEAFTPTASGGTFDVLWLPLTSDTAAALSLGHDRSVISHFIETALPRFEPPTIAIASAILEVSPFARVIEDVASLRQASSRLYERLRRHPDASVSMDLEGHALGARGHISTVQVAVDAVPDDPEPLIYVFDILAIGAEALGSHDATSLRGVLEDSRIVKVFHCCYGDAAALFVEYGIELRGVFDTGIADCVALSRHPNKTRNLGVVISDWLGVTLQCKGTFVHSDRVWDTRPLPEHMVVYAYEDVMHCNHLFRRMRATLQDQGLFELVCTLSQQRAPPIALHHNDWRSRPAARVAIAVIDDAGRVLCLQSVGDGLCSLPSAEFGPAGPLVEPSQAKQFAKDAWAAVMGRPPKALRAAVNARMRKAVRVGDTLLYTTFVGDCAELLGAVSSAYEALNAQRFSHRVVTRQRYRPGGSGSGVVTSQTCLFQQLHAEAARFEAPKRKLATLYSAHSDASLYVSASLAVSACGFVSLSLFDTARANEPSVTAPDEAAACAVTVEPIRAAVILHDGRHVYMLSTRTKNWTFPSGGLESGVDPTDVAAKSFDLCAGVSLRKQPGVNSHRGQLLCPLASAFVRAAQTNEVALGQFGHTRYFAWHLDCQQASPGQLQLIDHLAAFHASRRLVNGFEMTAPKLALNPHFALVPAERALELVQGADYSALLAALSSSAPRAALTGGCVAQHNEQTEADVGRACVVWDSDSDDDISDDGSDLSSAETVLATPQCSTGNQQRCRVSTRPIPPSTEGCVSQHNEHTTVDECCYERGATSDSVLEKAAAQEFDSLFTAAVAVALGRAEQAEAATSSSHVTPPLLTRDQIHKEQLSHPATAAFIDHLRAGHLSEAPATAADADFLREAGTLAFSRDGLLVKRTEGLPDRLVLPPSCAHKVLQLYHDFNGHFGVFKMLPLITRRFYWGSDTFMRKTIGDYVRKCVPCTRAKVPHWLAGEYQIDSTATYPGEILSADVFDVGVIFDGYSHTLDFADHFTRGVRSTAVKGTPNQEDVVHTLLNVIMRYDGTPREVRSDRGSNLIAKGIQALYKRFRIRIIAGTAYRHHLTGLVERWHQTLKQLLLVQRATPNVDDNWPSRLAALELAFNATVNRVTGHSPFYVDHLRHPVLPFDSAFLAPPPDGEEPLPDWVEQKLTDLRVVYDAQLKGLRLNALNAKKAYDLRRDVQQSYRPGDRVLLIDGKVFDHAPRSKMDLPTSGPFTVSSRLPRDRYKLTDMKNKRIHDVVHVSRLLPFPDSPSDSSHWMVGDPLTGGAWPVHSVVGRRVNAKDPSSFDYKLRWVGFEKNYDLWRERRYLDSIAHLISIYDETHGRPSLIPRVPADFVAPQAAPGGPSFRYRARPYEPFEAPVAPAAETPGSFSHLEEPLDLASTAPAADEPAPATAQQSVTAAPTDRELRRLARVERRLTVPTKWL